MANDRRVSFHRDVVGNVVTTGDSDVFEAPVTAEQHERPPGPATADIAKELAAIRALVMSLVARRSSSILVGTVVTKRTGAPNDESSAS
jgi:hypothetical protein